MPAREGFEDKDSMEAPDVLPMNPEAKEDKDVAEGQENVKNKLKDAGVKLDKAA